MTLAGYDLKPRVCYLRAVSQTPDDTGCNTDLNSKALEFVCHRLERGVFQDKPPANITGGEPKPLAPRQHYILGIDTAVGKLAIDWLIQASGEGVKEPQLARSDLAVVVSRDQAKSSRNEELLQRLKIERVEIQLLTKHDLSAGQAEYPSSAPCDAFMLLKSDYALNIMYDDHANYDGDDMRYWDWRNSLRLGAPEEPEDWPERFWYDHRHDKMGHTRRGCCWAGKCIYWRHNHGKKLRTYKCPCCGGRCKRTKGCQKTGEYWMEEKKLPEWLREAEEDNGFVPPEFAREWMNLSSAETIERYNLRKGIATAGSWRWRSIDAFSGDVND
ncbi:hypothetical protein ACHAQH_009272 [Verticillium albo-atrum]